MAAPKEPRIDKTFTHGSFKSSIKDLNAPLIFLVGGIGVPGPGKIPTVFPGEYMWGTNNKDADGYEKGFNRCADFNVYNLTKVSRVNGTSQKDIDTSGIKGGVTECKKILNDNNIKPTKNIIVAFSKGCEAYEIVIDNFGGGFNTWDLVLIGGVFSGGKNTSDILRSVNKISGHLTKYPDKVFYFASGNDGTSPPALNKLKTSAKSGHFIEKPGSHSGLPNAMASYILDNVPVNNTAASSNPPSNPGGTQGTSGTPGTSGTSGTQGTNGTNDGGGGGQDGNTPEGTPGAAAEPVTSGNDCGDLSKLDAKEKANESPQGAENVDKDPLPPSKNDTPVSADGKYNHRYYLVPLKDNQPMSLADMVSNKQKYHKRYFGWRPDEGRGFGYKENENVVVSPTGTSLIAGLIPYWPPPESSGSLSPTDTSREKNPTIMGKWKNLIEGQKGIESFLDIPILLNCYDVGVYNNNIEYIFEAGNELHMTLIDGSIVTNKGSQIGIGKSANTDMIEKKNLDSSWRNWPKWSGIWVNHCLKHSGYSLLSTSIEGNINNYHEEILKKDKLINYPGNKQWKWKDLKAAGTQDNVFKPSKIWLDPTNLNSEELIKDSGDIAIFIPDFHFTKEGQITPKGEKLLKQLIKLKWKIGVISAVKSHTVQNSQLYAEVLIFLDEFGKIVTIGGNTTPKGADSSASQGHHIAIKETTFKDFAQIANDTWVNGAVFISNVKSSPEGHREGGLDSKIYVSSIYKDYYERIDKEPGKLTGRMYNTLVPYISKKPAAPAPEPIPDGQGIGDQIMAAHNIPAQSGAGGGDGRTVLGNPKDAEKRGILTAIPPRYRRNTGDNYLATPAVAAVIRMFEAGFSQGMMANPKPGDDPGGNGGGKLLMISDSFRTQQGQVDVWRPYAGSYAADGLRFNSINGDTSLCAPPMGRHNIKGEKAGGPHQQGRAIDTRGKTGSGAGTKDLAAIERYHQNNATAAQLWIRKNGIQFGWYPYWNEVWHFSYKQDTRKPGKYPQLWDGR